MKGPCRFWVGFLTFLLNNLLSSGALNLRDGFLIDYFNGRRKVSGMLCGLVQGAYGVGYVLAMCLNNTPLSKGLDVKYGSKRVFLWMVGCMAMVNLGIGLGQFQKINTVFITQDFVLRFILGAVSFKLTFISTDMMDRWFSRRRELFFGICLAVRFGGSALSQVLGSVIFVRCGYFITFLSLSVVMLLAAVAGHLLMSDPEDKAEEEEELGSETPHPLSYLHLITLAVIVSLWGIYSVLIVPYYTAQYGLDIDAATVYLTLTTVSVALSNPLVGWVLNHLHCFKAMLCGTLLCTLSPLLLFLGISQTVSTLGTLISGLGMTLGTLSLVKCMESTHQDNTKQKVLSSNVKKIIYSLWLGIWSLACNMSAILAGLAIDHLDYKQMAFSTAGLQSLGVVITSFVLVQSWAVKRRSVRSPESSSAIKSDYLLVITDP